jgi:putative ABC transport system permease protein
VIRWLDDAGRDLRYAVRALRRAPVFAVVVIATLALGIGANTAIFSVLNAVVLHSLTFSHADRLVRPYENIPAGESPNRRPVRLGGVTVRELLEVRARSRTLSHVTSAAFAIVSMIGVDDNPLITGSSVSAGTFEMLGAAAARGRLFTADEERDGGHVVILSHDAWRKYFNADPAAIGRTVTFGGNSNFTGSLVPAAPYTVVGVMPRNFHYPDETPQFWTPAALTLPPDNRPRRLPVIAKLAARVTVDAALAELTTIVSSVRGTMLTPSAGGSRRFELVRVVDETTSPVRQALLVLSGAVGFVLLIACANVANLLLARAAAREHETAVRLSLGASRARLLRQVFIECLLLSIVGGAAGLGLATALIVLFRRLATNLSRFDLGSTSFPRMGDIAIDPTVLAFALAVSVFTGLLFAVAPAMRQWHIAPMTRLRAASSARGLSLRRGFGAQAMLVVAEIALATMLFVGGGLLIRSFRNLAVLDPGYDTSHTLTFQVSLRGDRYSAAMVRAFAEAFVERLRAVPGVEAAGYSRQLPMVQLRETFGLRAEPAPPPPGQQPNGADARFVSRDYVRAIGSRLAAGRWPEGPRELAISRTLARRDFGAASPISRILYLGPTTVPYEVVAVLEDQRMFGLDREPQPQFFADLTAYPAVTNLLPLGPYYAVRTHGDPRAVLRSITGLVNELAADAPLYNVATLDEIVADSITRPRLYAVMLALFAGVAVALAAVGLYGVTSYAVAQRTREIGIRMALGARRTAVVALVLGQSGALIGAGLMLGLAGAAAIARSLQSLLFGVSPLDAPTFVAVTGLFAAIALAAAYGPARRASGVDPLVALRCE